MENELEIFLKKESKKTKYIYLSLYPQTNGVISKSKDNTCHVEIAGTVTKFKNVSEHFYDTMVQLYDKRSNL